METEPVDRAEERHKETEPTDRTGQRQMTTERLERDHNANRTTTEMPGIGQKSSEWWRPDEARMTNWWPNRDIRTATPERPNNR